MKAKNHTITVFEYQKLWVHKGEQRLSEQQLKSLEIFYGESGVPYYTLIHKGISFNSYVGVIQVVDLIIEVLPKADKTGVQTTEDQWRRMLIGMLNAVGVFNVHAPSSSSLNLKANNILDLYFQLFLQEVEYLLHRGLVKKYRKTGGNSNALKGSLHFAKHLQHNLIHQERFYVRHTIYDKEHQLHQILYKAIKLLNQINTNTSLNATIGSLMLNFPEVQDISVSEATFERLDFNRKTESYRNAVEIAKLLLLNYHPDVNRGRESVLALMFDMNVLWEQFVYASLRKNKAKHHEISPQTRKLFWRKEGGKGVAMRPDIVVKTESGTTVLDTKWKNLNDTNPSPDDLRQMYVYHEYFTANKVALVYPGSANKIINGFYVHRDSQQVTEMECAVVQINIELDIKRWQKSISENIGEWQSSGSESL